MTISVLYEFGITMKKCLCKPLDETTSQSTVKNKDWPPDFFEKTAGCLTDDPIERAPQGDYEIREILK